MKDTKLNVLCLINNFNGSHATFKVFYSNLIEAFEKSQCNVFVADNVQTAIDIINNYSISFCICIGEYSYFFNNKPIYDCFKILNYQWIIDNPYKYKIDRNSKYNRLVFIDGNFRYIENYDRNDFLCLSLGCQNHFIRFDKKLKYDAILAPLKLRDFKVIKSDIEKCTYKNLIYDFINKYDFSNEFIPCLNSYFRDREIKDFSQRKDIFKNINSYLRMKKRIDLINSIKDHKIFILSDFRPKEIVNSNVEWMDDSKFDETLKLFQKFRFVLNVNPNYDDCLHERISYSVANGSIIITDSNKLLTKLKFPLSFTHDNFNEIDGVLSCIDDNQIFDQQAKIIREFSMYKQAKIIISNFYKNRI